MTAVAEAAGAPRFTLRSRPARAVLALAQVEGRRLLLHPAPLLALAPVLIYSVGMITQTDARNVVWIYLGWFLLPACGTMIAANFAALRSRRAGTEDLFASLLVSGRPRTAAHLLSLAWAVTALAVLLAGFTWSLYTWTNKTVEFGDRPQLAVIIFGLANGPALVAAFGAFGVLLARWLPHLVVAPVAAVGLFRASGVFSDTTRSSLHWLSPLTTYSDRLDEPAAAMGWHSLYLLGVALVFGSLALLRSGRDARVLAAGGTGLALVAIAATLMLG